MMEFNEIILNAYTDEEVEKAVDKTVFELQVEMTVQGLHDGLDQVLEASQDLHVVLAALEIVSADYASLEEDDDE